MFWPTDTNLPISDHWICLLNAYYHRFAFYDKRFAFYDKRFAFGFHTTWAGQGGMAEYRHAKAEQEGTQYLQRAFGDAIEQIVGRSWGGGGGTTGTVGGNTVRLRRRMNIPWSG